MIGILTYFQHINYGTYLQAYALQNLLKDLGCENELINYRTKKNQRSEYRSLMIKGERDGRTRRLIRLRILVFKTLQKRLNATKRYLDRGDLSQKHYSAVIIGSDQIWCYTQEWAGLETAFYSAGLSAAKIVSYAASLGPDRHDQEHPRIIARLMKNFKHVGVRDTNTYRFAEAKAAVTPVMVLDPTLVFRFNEESASVREDPYLLFYSDGLLPSADLIYSIRKIAEDNQLKIIAVGETYHWCDMNLLTITPFQWMRLIKNARFVFTCMFHGLMFCVKFRKPFAMYLNEGRKNKGLDFLQRIGLASRVVDTGADLSYSFHNAIDYAPVNDFLAAQITDSIHFLKTAILLDPRAESAVEYNN
jgi:hypothetical protein